MIYKFNKKDFKITKVLTCDKGFTHILSGDTVTVLYNQNEVVSYGV